MIGARSPWAKACAWGAVLTFGLALAGCSARDLLDKMSSPEDRGLAQKAIADLQGGPGDDADLASHLQPELRGRLAGALPPMRAAMPRGPGSQIRLVDASFTSFVSFTNHGQTTRVGNLAYEVDGGGKSALVRMQIVRQGGGDGQIGAFYVNSLKAPVDQLAGFSLAGKSAVQYAVLALAALSLLLIIVSEVVLVCTKRIPLKWLWFIGCLLGYGQVSVDWNSGALGFQPLYIQLLGAFALKAGFLAPWRVGFAIPVVSIIFLILRRRLQKPLPKQAEQPVVLGD